jgi:solute:Na+ symporter, SSS family
MNVHPIDWIILAIFFLAFLAIAIYVNSRCRSVADYLVSGRKVRMWLGMGAGIAGELGLVSIVSVCEQGYLHGFAFVVLGVLSMVITVPLFGIFGFGIERFRATKAMSVPQYIEMRFSRRLRIVTGMTNSLAGVFQMCIFPIAGASFVRVLMRAPEYSHLVIGAVPTDWIIMFVLLICPLMFTYLGGYTTLIVTNFLQMILISVAIYGVFFLVLKDMGIQNYWSGLEKACGTAGFNPFASEGESYGVTWFAWLMAMTILLQFSYGPYLQKYASMDRPKTVSQAYLLGQVFGNGRTFVIIGLGVAALVALGPQSPPHLHVTDTIWHSMATAYYLAGKIPAGLMGIVLAGLLFADVATTDAYILSWSTSIVNDCILPFCAKPFIPKRQIRAVRITIFVLCVIFFLFGMVYKPTTSLWDFMWLCADIIGGTGVAVLLGMYWRRATTAGAYAAICTCLVLPTADLIARRVYLAFHSGTPFPISPQTTGLYTYLLATALMVIVSLLSGERSKYWDLGKAVSEMNAAAETSRPNQQSTTASQ